MEKGIGKVVFTTTQLSLQLYVAELFRAILFPFHVFHYTKVVYVREREGSLFRLYYFHCVM